MRTRLLLAFTLTTSLTAPAAAEAWYGTYNSGEVIAYGDTDSITRNGNIAQMMMFLSHNPGDYHKWLVDFDCPANQFRLIAASNYGADRQYLGTPDYDTGWYAIADQAVANSRGLACDGLGSQAVVSDPFSDAEDYWYYYYYYDE